MACGKNKLRIITIILQCVKFNLKNEMRLKMADKGKKDKGKREKQKKGQQTIKEKRKSKKIKGKVYDI